MAEADLRHFLKKLDEMGELVRIGKEIENGHEVFGILWELAQREGPAAIIEKVKGHNVPLVVNLQGTLDRFAMACGFPTGKTPKEYQDLFIEALDSSKWPQPQVVAAGPCKEVILKGDDVDLTKLPILQWHPSDGGPYITLPIVITKDDRWGYNAAVYRMMVHDRNTTGVMCNIFQDQGVYAGRALSKGKDRMECAVAIGASPALYVSAVTKVPLNESEFGFAGRLQGEPVKLVKCETIDLEVPADAEIVLEGEILLNEQRTEGPYGEWMGYFEEQMELPIFRVKCITTRRNPYYYTTIEGPDSGEAEIIRMIPQSATFTKSARERITGFHDAWLPHSGHNYMAVIAIKKRYPGWGREAIYQAIGMPYIGSSANFVIIVDDDIDPSDMNQVVWALSTRVDPINDVIITPPVGGYPLNPAASARPPKYSGTGSTDIAFCSKIGIDATLKMPEEGRMRPAARPVLPPDDIIRLVKERWSDYGFKK